MNKLLFVIVVVLQVSCSAQENTSIENRPLGGPCEDCIAALDYKTIGITPESKGVMTGYDDHQPQLLIEGIVYQNDGKTPAPDVILYIYQTDREGLYSPSDNPKGWERRHGQYRIWLKTNQKGEYSFKTFRPAAYPTNTESEHIHIYVAESGKSPYYIDNYVFADDTLLTQERIRSFKDRGGSGILNINSEGYARRDIILGKNIPNYK